MRFCSVASGSLLLLLASVCASPGAAQRQEAAPIRAESPAAASFYADSWALVIGINAYQKVSPRLNYAVQDAEAVASALPDLGFPRRNITLLKDRDATKARIEEVLYREFTRMGPEDRLFVFFAGHGETAKIKSGEEGYLLPVDADLKALPLTAIAMDEMKRIGQRVRAKHVFFAIDACFSGFALTRDILPQSSTDEYLSAALREPVVQVLVAGRKGERAIEEGGHGLFTRRFLDALRGLADSEGRGIVTVGEIAAWIEPRVVRDSKGKMTPQYGKLDGEGQFVFMYPRKQVASLPAPPDAVRPTVREEAQPVGSLSVSSRTPGIEVLLGDQKLGETKTGSMLVVSNLVPGTYRLRASKDGFKPWQREVSVAPSGKTDVLIDLEPIAPSADKPLAYAPSASPGPGLSASQPIGQDQALMVFVPEGAFLMGARDEDLRASPAEKPQRQVHLDGFWIDQFEVTNAQYKLFRDATRHRAPLDPRDPLFNGPSQPVVGVSWEDAQQFCRWAGKRLPTEAEWEKAARGLSGGTYPWGDAQVADHAHVMKTRTSEVGKYPQGASPYGLMDMAGNVWEWVQDWYAADYYRKDAAPKNPKGPAIGGEKVLRGGSFWERTVWDARATARHHQTPEKANNNVGFRCARNP